MKIHILFACLFFAALTGARADLTIVSEIKSADIKAAEMGNMTMKLANDKVRVDTGPAHIIILPAEKKMMIIIDAQKMIMVKTLNDTGASSSSGQPPAIERTGKTETINGYNCQQILLKDSKGRVTELWVSSTAPDMSQFAASFLALKNANPKKSDFEWSGLMSQKDLNTYPIRTIRYAADGKEEMRITVLSISTTPIPATEFTAPAGYMEMQMPDFGGADGTDVGSSIPSAPGGSMQMRDMQKIVQSGNAPSQGNVQKMQAMVLKMQEQMQNK